MGHSGVLRTFDLQRPHLTKFCCPGVIITTCQTFTVIFSWMSFKIVLFSKFDVEVGVS